MKNKINLQSRNRLMAIALLLAILFSSKAFAAETILAWEPNAEENLAGYKIYYGLTSGNYTTIVDVGNPSVQDSSVQAIISDLESDTTYYAVATAYDAEGLEGPYSDEVIWTTPLPQELLPPTPRIESVREINQQ